LLTHSAIATADDGTVKLWSIEGQKLQTLSGHDGGVKSVVFSPDGKILASASNISINLWKRNFTGQFQTQPYKNLTGHTTWVNDLAFSPDGKMLASASEDTTVKLWTLEGEELQTLYGHGDGNWIRSIVFRPNDKKIVSAGAGEVILWNLEDLSLDKLMEPACHWVRDYLKNNPNVDEGDRDLCDG
jgi:WD40 repeat protein